MGARSKEGTGLTDGDNIEHLWAWLRRHSHQLKYMSDGMWLDTIIALVCICARLNSGHPCQLADFIRKLLTKSLLASLASPFTTVHRCREWVSSVLAVSWQLSMLK